MTPHAIRRWVWVHKWSSLVCTVFLLSLCITGLPLIFHHEIEDASRPWKIADLPEGTPRAGYDRLLQAAQARYPRLVPQYLLIDEDEPNAVTIGLGPAPAAQEGNRYVVVDARTARVAGEPDYESGVMYVLLKLHVDMFAGLPGKLFLGVMGMLFVAAVISGVVVYAPYMGRQAFASVRTRSTRLRWFDLHNVLGIVTVAWALVVGATGVVNTWADLAIRYWQVTQMAEMTAPYRGQPPLPPGERASLDGAVAGAARTLPGMELAFIAFPGTLFSSPHHYAVFGRGTTPLTSKLLKPALIDAKTGELTDSRDLPWYISGLLLSQPLHFGDYGGLPLKIVWAILDFITIVVLGSGLYLWLFKRKRKNVRRDPNDTAERCGAKPDPGGSHVS
ncbi:MAG TPA: PepSY domain-containing protein [Ramlibacter sp.]|uniref:PepSY-associated TM helix domain-containing protein n=1 Tax=Ramlibacter sp. TaxID=1917967 RepID=UPI002CE5AADD|nr:PepSY domain-containing protein [Ramlibacter sp.]HVZ44481.1 PepSY domain-containing protein [Ramlibacter sp.]